MKIAVVKGERKLCISPSSRKDRHWVYAAIVMDCSQRPKDSKLTQSKAYQPIHKEQPQQPVFFGHGYPLCRPFPRTEATGKDVKQRGVEDGFVSGECEKAVFFELVEL